MKTSSRYLIIISIALTFLLPNISDGAKNKKFYGLYEVTYTEGVCPEETVYLTIGKEKSRAGEEHYIYIHPKKKVTKYRDLGDDINNTVKIESGNINYSWTSPGQPNTNFSLQFIFSDGTISGTSTYDDAGACQGLITGSFKKIPDYLPLRVGNKWKYTSFIKGKYRNDKIIGTETIDGNLTYIKERKEPPPDNYNEKMWIARESGFYVIYRFWGNEGADPAIDALPPVEMFKLDPQLGDIWSAEFIGLTFQYNVLAVNETVKVRAGKFKNCVKIELKQIKDGIEQKTKYQYYAPGVGMIKDENIGEWTEELVSAKVDGKTY